MIDVSKISHIFFDLDHTLWDFDKNSALAFERVFDRYNISISISEFLKIYEPINFDYWKLYREEKVNKLNLRRGRLKDSFKPFGLHFSENQLDVLADLYIEELPKDNHLFPNTNVLLLYLSKKYILHIITNGFKEVQHKKIYNSGIHNYFSSIITSEDAGVKKPNPLIFNMALQMNSINANQAIMIGDSFEADILGAEAVGMQTIFFNYRKEITSSQNLQVSKLLDIKKYL